MDLTIHLNNPEITQLGLATELDFCKAMATAKVEDPGFLAVTIGLKEPILNLVIDTRVDEKDVLQKIAQAKEFFQQQQVSWIWLVSPLSKPLNLSHYLEQSGLSLLEQTPAMYYDLTRPLPVPEEVEENINIREAGPTDELREWIMPVQEGFPNSSETEGFRALSARLPHGPGTPFRHYMIRQGGQAVGSVTLYLGTQGVMILNLATRNIARRRGYGKALTRYAMLVAKREGFKHCFLNTSEKGYNLYRKLGFQVYCVNRIYGFK